MACHVMLIDTEQSPLSRGRPNQLRLFSLPDPLTQRFGADFFRSLPREPGVYFFYDSDDTLLYIGQSLDLRARIGSYRHVTPEKHPKRTLRLVGRVTRIEWQLCSTAKEAVALESALLLEHRPPFNRAGVWQGDPWWLDMKVNGSQLSLALNRREVGFGPLPRAFRYVLGTLVRYAHRCAIPGAALSSFPHRLLDALIPATLSFTTDAAQAMADAISGFLEGRHDEFLSAFEALPPAASPMEQGYWLEELEILKRYAAKTHVITLPAEREVMHNKKDDMKENELCL